MAVDIIARAMAAMGIKSGGTGDGGTFGTDGPTVFTVGGIPAGTVLKGKTWEQILTLMLFGSDAKPVFTDPSFRVVMDEKYGVIGNQMTVSGTAYFDRGKIEPAYGTSGYRAGLPNSYVVNGSSFTTTAVEYKFTATLDIQPGENMLTVTVNFDAGEQPKDGIGNDYDQPYPAGSLSYEVTITGTYPVYSGGGDDMQAMDIQQQFGEKGYLDASVPDELAGADRQAVAFPTEGTPPILGVQAYDPGRQVWDWIYGSPEASLTSFTQTQTTININGVDVEYTVWNNNSIRVGERTLRFFTVLPDEGEGV